MAVTAAELTKVLGAIVTGTKKLGDDEVQALADGSAELRYVPSHLVKYFNALTRLSDDQVEQLTNGQAEFKFALKAAKVTKVAAVMTPPPSANEIRQAMLEVADEASARAYFAALKLKAPELKQIALELDLPATGAAKVIVDGIVKVLVTGRLTTSAVRF